MVIFLFWAIIIGMPAGFLASKIVKGSGVGIWFDVLMGIVWSLIGGWIFRLLGLVYGLFGQLVVATVGAIVLLLIVKAIKK
jgi:uncharacterized membrane protein YeaQ/YmgE (transglycosylase-associated protein family)